MLRQSPTRFRYFVFDADGTIFDSMQLHEDALVELLSRFDVSEARVRQAHTDLCGVPLVQAYREILGPICTRELAEQLVDAFFDAVLEIMPKLFDRVRDTLMRMHWQNYRLFLSSGTRTDVLRRRVRHHDLTYFWDVMGTGVIPKGLGHLEVFAHMMRVDLETFCSRACMVGDGLGDMKLAKEAGMYAVGLPILFSREDLLAAGADEVIGSVSGILG